MCPVFRTVFDKDRKRLFCLVLRLLNDRTSSFVVEGKRAALLAFDDRVAVVSEYFVSVLLLTELDVGKVKVLE